jgi:hypothetical protein
VSKTEFVEVNGILFPSVKINGLVIIDYPDYPIHIKKTNENKRQANSTSGSKG